LKFLAFLAFLAFWELTPSLANVYRRFHAQPLLHNWTGLDQFRVPGSEFGVWRFELVGAILLAGWFPEFRVHGARAICSTSQLGSRNQELHQRNPTKSD